MTSTYACKGLATTTAAAVVVVVVVVVMGISLPLHPMA
jgi:hypothetical protein